jgi:L-lactate permease
VLRRAFNRVSDDQRVQAVIIAFSFGALLEALAGFGTPGVLGKMISTQNLAIGAAAVGLGGQEGVIFRKVLGWSILLILIMCVIIYLQSTSVLDWMVVGKK